MGVRTMSKSEIISEILLLFFLAVGFVAFFGTIIEEVFNMSFELGFVIGIILYVVFLYFMPKTPEPLKMYPVDYKFKINPDKELKFDE